nr:integrase, catalytic region, zinc finger, CCHC-type, peptidase aspartic, catalytic [Tanacetum cinerariifolium]
MTLNLTLLINFTWKFMGTVRFKNSYVDAVLGYMDLEWGDILITRVYYVEGLGHNLFSVRNSMMLIKRLLLGEIHASFTILKAITSNPLKPKSIRFPKPPSLLGRLSKFVYVRFKNSYVDAVLGYMDLEWGDILITRVYYVEGLGHNLFSVRNSMMLIKRLLLGEIHASFTILKDLQQKEKEIHEDSEC